MIIYYCDCYTILYIAIIIVHYTVTSFISQGFDRQWHGLGPGARITVGTRVGNHGRFQQKFGYYGDRMGCNSYNWGSYIQFLEIHSHIYIYVTGCLYSLLKDYTVDIIGDSLGDHWL